MINIIAALTKNRVIGQKNDIPWNIKEDMALFRKLTINNTVIMGKNTFLSLERPLKNRYNLIVSTTLESTEGVEIYRSLDAALKRAENLTDEIFLIGGASVYKAGLAIADRMYLSWIKKDYAGDTFFPEFSEEQWDCVAERDYAEFVFKEYRKK